MLIGVSLVRLYVSANMHSSDAICDTKPKLGYTLKFNDKDGSSVSVVRYSSQAVDGSCPLYDRR